MRLYIPATLDDLRDGALTLAVPRRAHAVTAALIAALPDEDEEGVEFAAQLMAADDALILLAGAPLAPPLRLVVTADVDEELVNLAPAAEDEPVSLVTLTGEVSTADVVCVHVDEPQAAAQVARALDGEDVALEDLAERDLLWYDVTELSRIPRS